MGTQLALFEEQETSLTTIDENKLNEALGFNVQKSKFAYLKINKDAEDDKSQPLPVGQFYLNQDPIAYSKNVEMRILWRGFQYSRYNSDQRKTTDTSIIMDNFGEFISTSGKLRCGRLTNKQVEELGEKNISSDQKILQEEVKLKTLFFCLLSGDFKTQSGEAVRKDNILCCYIPGFKSAMILDTAIKGIVKEGKPVIKAVFNVTTSKEKTGGNTYYVPEVSYKGSVDLVPQDTVALKEVISYVGNINKFVTSAYEKSLSGKPQIVDAEVIDDGKMNDQIPF